MDYSKTYTYFFDKTIRILSKLIKSYFINSKTKDRPFHTVQNRITERVHDVYLNKYLHPLTHTYPKVINIFSKRYDYYQSDNVLQFVFEDEILEEYRKIKNHASANDTYLKLVANLAILEALNVLISRLHSHQDYLELVYELKSWENFTLANLPKGIKNSDKYLAMFKERFPNLNQPDNGINKVHPTHNNQKSETIASQINHITDNKIKLLPEQDSNHLKGSAASPNNQEEDVFLTTEEVAILISLSRFTVYGLVHKNKIPYHKKGKRLYFLKSEILEWIKSGKRWSKFEMETKANEYLAKKTKSHKKVMP